MSDKKGVEIDYRPKCRGIWLDRGEREKSSSGLQNIIPTKAILVIAKKAMTKVIMTKSTIEDIRIRKRNHS